MRGRQAKYPNGKPLQDWAYPVLPSINGHMNKWQKNHGFSATIAMGIVVEMCYRNGEAGKMSNNTLWKRKITIAIMAGLLLLPAGVDAAIRTINGTGEYIMEDNETMKQA